MEDMDGQAVLSNDGAYTSFSSQGRTIRFRTPRALNRYLDVVEWDRGYLVVNADYKGLPSPTQEYMDLVPILENLYIDPSEFLTPIEEVVVR